jgi:hypothetical protein
MGFDDGPDPLPLGFIQAFRGEFGRFVSSRQRVANL